MKMNLKALGLVGVLFSTLLMAGNVSANPSNIDDILSAGDPLYEDLVKSCFENVKKDCEVWAKEGGEMPRGLSPDTKVELAIGEVYILAGTIEIMGGAPYLRIDFRAQPWLANRTRMKNPVYRIDDQAVNWLAYRGKRLTIVGTTRYKAFVSAGRTMLEIYIEPSAQPVVKALQRRR